MIVTIYYKKFLHDLSTFNIFYRTKVKELLEGTCREIEERTNEKKTLRLYERREIHSKQMGLYVLKVEGKFSIMICEGDVYSETNFFSLATVISNGLKDTIEESIKTKIVQIQEQIEEIREIALQNLETIMQRSEKLEDLMTKTKYISENSREFLDSTKKMNGCCNFL